MGQPQTDREKLQAKIRALEIKLINVPVNRAATVADSVKHASQQIAYWRCWQVLASYDKQHPDPDIRKAAEVEARKASEQAAEWERRKNDSIRNQLEAEKVERLAAIQARIDAQLAAAGDLQDIKT